MVTPICVWAAGRTGGIFGTLQQAVSHCKVLTNDHRHKVELVTLVSGAVVYVGPRGRRHGTRLIAYLGTREQLQMIGLDLDSLALALMGPK